MEEIHRLHKDELEIQQLQHYQTFRNYREMFEEQKAAIEQRFRNLLEDAVQDAVFLSSRNNELVDENQELRQRKYSRISIDRTLMAHSSRDSSWLAETIIMVP